MSFATPHKQSKRVTFATTECTSVFIPSADLSEEIPIPTKDSICTRTLTSRRMATPHAKKTKNNKPRLIESGAVRVQIETKTNPRRNKNHIASHRLIDQGAVRLNITRHTTPRRRRLHKSRSQLYSPPLTSLPQSDKLYRHNNNDVSIAATSSFTPANTPATKKYTPNRSNAHYGGHRFRASLSPRPPSKILLHSTPINTIDTHNKENNNDNLGRLVEHSAVINEQQEAREETLSRMLF